MSEKGMEAFLAATMGKTLRRASEILNLSQSSVSYRLKQFEKELGLILLDRQKGLKTVRLTPSGERLLPIVIQWRKLQHEINNLKAEPPARYLRIGAVDSVHNLILPPLFEALRTNDAPIYLKLSTNDSGILYKKVESHELDVAFVLQSLPNPNIHIEAFHKEEMVVARSADGVFLQESVEARELDSRYELRIEWGPEFQLWHDQIWDPLSIIEIYLDTIPLIVNLLRDEKQWAVVPVSATPLLLSKGLRFQRLIPAPPDRICYKIKHRFPHLAAIEAIDILETLIAESNKQPRQQTVR